ncbi:MAG: MBL fold metallo-hydrolase [Anaerolineales bacterium]|nr:MBL fold metallo-hydrolase [Anaerolineales bacterium]
MPLDNKNLLRIHFVDVGHGDAIIMEFPDYGGKAHYAIVDTGRPELKYRNRAADYLNELLEIREKNDFEIDFICITHPHEDHYGGMKTLLERYGDDSQPTGHRIRQFWDCGFRTTAKTYNGLLEKVADDPQIVYTRLASGAEYEFGDVRIYILAPSLDLRNRFDTFGVDRNNASLILKVAYGKSSAILSGDAHFDSWGKVVEEFPRTTKITYFKDAQVERSEGPNQLKCQLLKVSHHGSKHGTSLEYLEKLKPIEFVITCAKESWYMANRPGWGTEWPHPLTDHTIHVVRDKPRIRLSHEVGNIVYKLDGKSKLREPETFHGVPGTTAFRSGLSQAL